MNKGWRLARWYILASIAIAGSFVAGNGWVAQKAGLNEGDVVLRMDAPQVGADATAAQQIQLDAIAATGIAYTVYRANGVYEPYKKLR